LGGKRVKKANHHKWQTKAKDPFKTGQKIKKTPSSINRERKEKEKQKENSFIIPDVRMEGFGRPPTTLGKRRGLHRHGLGKKENKEIGDHNSKTAKETKPSRETMEGKKKKHHPAARRKEKGNTREIYQTRGKRQTGTKENRDKSSRRQKKKKERSPRPLRSHTGQSRILLPARQEKGRREKKLDADRIEKNKNHRNRAPG